MADKGKRIIDAGGRTESATLHEEAIAVAATLPGLVVSKTAAGFGLGAAGGAKAYVADFNYLKGLTVDDAWAINENMIAINPTSGKDLNVRLAASQTIVEQDALKDSGSADGYLVKATLPTDAALVVCYADEAVTTDGSGAGTFIRAKF